jgi:NADH-quinone oxidoreductase subunit N
MWAPDAYEGAPTPVTAFMAASVKAAAFAAFLRIWIEGFGAAYAHWHLAVWWLAAITMVVGNVVALSQRNIKRMLAYSSIAHAGYIMVAVVAGTNFGTTAFLFYLLAYTLATMGAFAVVVAVGRAGGSFDSLDEWAGLWHVRPGLAAAMAIFMLALLGFPVFGGIGFFAKWYVLRAALESQRPQIWLAVVLVLTSVVSAGYYLYVVMLMFMRARRTDAPLPAPSGGWTRLVIGASAVVILVLGLWPTPLVDVVARGVPTRPAVVPISRAGPELPGVPAR